ncbi:MAG: DUF4145 domain-containing protein [Rhizobium sp.]|nr:DUF4145 domain-containing protein [Rhizobium sp.]
MGTETAEIATSVATKAAEQDMTWLEFVASIVQSLVTIAWPAAVVLSVWMFRNEIRPLLPMFRLKHKDTEISFRLDEAERAAEQLPPSPSADTPETQAEQTKFERLAAISPRSALIEIRREIQDALAYTAGIRGLDAARKFGPRNMLRKLSEAGVITPTVFPLFDDIIAIGNIAAHDSSVDFTIEQALRYRELADRALAWLSTSSVSPQE